MDLTPYPESIHHSLTDLLTALDSIYKDYPESIIKFLAKVLHKFEVGCKAECQAVSTQTEESMKLQDNDVNVDEINGNQQSRDVVEQVWDLKSLAEDVRTVAEETLNKSSFVYDDRSGTYYNHDQQCYYIPEQRLYYYIKNEAYYTYDEENNCMQFYSSCSKTELSERPVSGKLDEINDNAAFDKENVKVNAIFPKELEPTCNPIREIEEGEIVDDEVYGESVQDVCPQQCSSTQSVISASPTKIDLNVEPKGHCAPCIRITVRECESDQLEVGQLFIITRSGGTLGREGRHDIIIPDVNVSKDHLSFFYTYKDGTDVYEVIDSSSKNRTYLNGCRLKQNKPFQILHGSVLKIGSTSLLCHIHEGMGTCNECEPSCLGFKPTMSPSQHPQSPPQSLKERHAHQINRIKRKFGLHKIKGSINLPKGYEDKSKLRRETVGSSHDSEKMEVTSTDVPIRSDNKGYEMLTKMGWKNGEAVGKSGDGSTSPVNVIIKLSKRGLGCADDDPSIPIKPKSKATVLEITRKRYEMGVNNVAND